MRRIIPHSSLAAVIGGVALLGGLTPIENRLAALRFRSLASPATGRVVVVSVDVASLRRAGGWPIAADAAAIRGLLDAGAERIALSGDFDAVTPETDEALTAAIRPFPGRVVVSPTGGGDPAREKPVDPNTLPAFAKVATLARPGASVDRDGAVRRYRYNDGSNVRSLASALIGRSAPAGHDRLDCGITVESIPHLAWSDVLAGRFPRSEVDGRFVIIGPAETGAAALTVPVAGRIPVPTLEALAAESLLQGRVMRQVPRWVTVLITLALGALFGVLIAILPPWIGLLAALPAVILLVGLPFLAQSAGGLLVEVSSWCLTVTGCYLLGLSRIVRQQNVAVNTSTQRMRQSERMTRRVLDKSLDAIVMVDRQGDILAINPACETLFGVTRREVTGQNVGRILDNSIGVFATDDGEAEGEAPRLLQSTGRRKDGRRFPVELAVVPIEDGDRTIRVGFIRDITARQAQEDLLRHQATHDALTGLPNRVLLQERVAEALKEARTDKQAVAFMILDLDRFKEINDTLGHQAGDALLQTIARRLEAPLRQSDTIARLGGDEFAVLLPMSGAAAAHLVATRLVESLEESFELSGLSLHVEASIGVSIFPDHGEEPAMLIQRADVAMYAAKKSGTRIRFYEASDDFSSVQQLSLKSDLRRALETNEFELHYQPKVAAAGGLLGVEALLRWNHPKRGRLAPGEFIGIAEHTGLIRGITAWALKEAIRQAAIWDRAGLELPVAVNLSARNLLQGDLPATVDSLLKKYNLPPERAVLEITESMIVEDPKLASDVVGRLRGLGVRISIDDFGTGYSSLSYLRNFPASELKIDKSFVTCVEENPGDRAIVRSTIELAHNLGLRCIAEGVENEGAWQLLQSLGCDGAQGYFFSKPLPAGPLEAWVADSRWARMSLGTLPDAYRASEGEEDELWKQVAEVREILERR